MGVLQLTWDEGQRICRWLNQNGHLVEFYSHEELQDVTGYLNEHYGSCSHWPSGGPWIGAVEVADTNEFIWQSTNSTVAVANWIHGQPNNPSAGDAAMMECEFAFEWMDKERDTVRPILCEMPPRAECSAEFTAVGDTCYYIGNSKATRDAAQEYCRVLAPNGKLAELETAEEIYAATEFMIKNGNNRRAEERGVNGEYYWASSGRPVIMTNWMSGDVPFTNVDDAIVLDYARNSKTCDHPFEETPGGKCLFNPMGALRLTWDEGQRICRWLNENGRLVEFYSYEELQDVTSYLNENYAQCSQWPSGGPWMGAVGIPGTNKFIWQSTNSTVVVANWIEGEPKSSSDSPAVAVMMNCEFAFKWMVKERGNVLPILCEIPPRRSTCPAEFTPVGDTCYFIGDSATTWDGAQLYCRDLAPNGKLAEFETAEEIYAVTEFLIKNNIHSDCAEERGTDQEYYWASSRKTVFITNFMANYSAHPNNNDILFLRSDRNFKTCDHPFEETPGGKCLFNPMGLIQATWDEGQRVCRWIHENGHLVEFQTYEEMLDVTGYLNEHYGSCSNWPSGGPWIGAIEVADTNDFIWYSNNSTVLIDNWATEQPNSPTFGDAAMMTCEFSFEWLDKERDNVLPILCEMPPRSKCPEAFTPVGDTCYYLGDAATNWETAQEFCKVLTTNGKLAEFETAEEIYAVTDFLINNAPPNRNYWMGAEERGVNEDFYWVSSGKPMLAMNWRGGNGFEGNTNDTMFLEYGTNYRWNDWPRTNSAYELCEADPADLS
ncbi:unnamed protein product [Cyprideis torosa]|uniref:Uncharacterized protein n=1 Tax=Cyprideis torosa TaxID=163714 RepID=A0A7R8ZQU5_9CRUS|nr:unnamed protein product [Cyprideis torosa]CAG0892802.1 unnamed protein product [Cyprideis torosa]